MARSTIAKPKKKASPKRARPHRSASPLGELKTFRAAVGFLDSAVNFEKLTRVQYGPANFNLSRMNRLLASLDNPQRRFRSVHVAGTKGKGSTATMTAEMLRNCGYKVGLYTSPHVSCVRERIWVDGEIITESAFTKIMREVAPAAKAMKGAQPTYFELMTAAAFLYFSIQKVEIAVIEVGIGGRLDSTNVVNPEVSVITSISYDHVGQLGNTLEQIASEKAGIIKNGVPVISAPQTPGVKRVLRETAAKHNAPLAFVGEDVPFSYRFESAREVGPHTRLSLTTQTSRFEHLHVPLLGEHQAINCALALIVLDRLKARGFKIDDQKAVEGLPRVRMIGRMEMISDQPRILVDGAHNAASVEALMRAIGQSIRYDSMVVIFGCHKDKDIAGMLKHVQLGADKVIFTTTGSPRAVDPTELAARYAEISGKMAQVGRTLRDSVAIAAAAVGREDLICITGSFYLVGEARRQFGKLITD